MYTSTRHLPNRHLIGAMLMLIGGALQAAEPGTVTLQSQTADSVTLASGSDRVYVRVLKPNLLQVDYRPGNQTSPNTLIIDPNFDSKNWTPGAVTITEDGSEVKLTTTAMVVRIAKSPCRVNIYNTDGTTRIFGEPSDGGMTDTRVKFNFDSGINWYGIQSAPSTRGRSMGLDSELDTAAWSALSMVKKLSRQSVTPAPDLNARYHGSQTGPFAWTTGAANKPGFGVLWDNDGGSVAFSGTTLEMNKTGERAVSSVSTTKKNTLWFAMVGTPAEITQAMIEVSGKPQMFPKYAHGFGNTEWGINEQEMRSHINAYRSRKIPLDHFILDFDWKLWDLNDYGNFEWNTSATAADKHYAGYPSAADSTLKTQLDAVGVKLMGITKPRLHVDTVHGNVVTQGDPAGASWRNGDSTGWWLPSGSPSNFKTDYWSGFRGLQLKCANVNFFIPAARAWYGKNTIDRAFDKGIVGYWHDEGDEGHDTNDIHVASNHYNTLYQEGVFSYQRTNKGVRGWSMNRHSYLGSQRYGYGVWSGDIDSDWRTLQVEAPRMLQTINAGMARTSTDGGGTSGQDTAIGPIGTGSVNKHIPSAELYARYVQFTAMQPTFRLHGVWKIQRQPWFYGEAEEAVTDVVRLRSRLMPYIYAHDRIYSETGIPFVRPLLWESPKDANLAERADAWMFGRHLLAAPILHPRDEVISPMGGHTMAGSTTKQIYLPAGTWYDYFRGTQHTGGAEFTYDVSTSTMRDLPLYIKKGAIIPTLTEALDHVAAKAVTTVRLDMFPDTTLTTFPYYDDDGLTYQYEGGTYFKQDVSVQQSGGTVTVTLAAKQGSYTPALTHYLVAINKFAATAVNGLTKYGSQAELEAASGEGWAPGIGVHGSVTLVKVAAGSARTITVTGASTSTLAIVTASLPAATRNAPYDVQLGADGLGASATWSVNPALPAGLVLDQRTGRITGVPTVVSSASHTFQVASGSTVSKALTLTVTAAPFFAHEAFRYTSGAIDYNGIGGENGFAEPWMSINSALAQGQDARYLGTYVNGLSATGLTTTGGAIELASVQTVPGNTNSQKNPDYARKMLTGFTDSSGSNAWIGFIGQGVAPGNGWYGVGLFQGTTEKLHIGQFDDKSEWGASVAGGGGKAHSSTSMANSSFVVVNIRVISGSNREVRMWINPTVGATAPSDASAAFKFDTGTNLSFDTLRLRGDSMVSKLRVDELRVAGTFAEICGITSTTPELDVSRAGSAVSDGGTDTVAGSAAANPQNLSYVLTNSGSGTITLSGSVTVTGESNCSASVTTQPSTTIGAGQTSTLSVSVTPNGAGAWSFTLSVGNNDSDENPYNWVVSGTAAALPAPELDITRGGTAVADGATDTITGSAASIPQTLTYVLTNSGTGALSVTGSATIASKTNCEVSVSTAPASSIASGGTSELKLSVTPTAAGAWSFTISVANDDANENPYNWIVSGEASALPAPELDITRGGAAVIDGGTEIATDTVAGTARSLTYVLTNSGTGALTVTGSVSISSRVNCEASVTTAPAGSIAGGATSSLIISVTPSAAGDWSLSISIENNDANESPYNWTLSGTATAAQSGSVVYEPFSYDAGSLAGKNGGTGWTSAWDNGANMVAAPGLSVPGVSVAGNRADLNTVSFRALPNRLPNGTWWVSFLAESTTPGTLWGGVSFFDGATEQLFMGQLYNTSTWGLSGNGKDASSTKGTGAVSLIVVRLVLRAGADDATIWVDPVAGAEPSVASGWSINAFGELNPDRIRIGSGTPLRIDELRLADSYMSVVNFSSGSAELDITRGGAAVADGSSDSATGIVAGTTRALTYVLTNSGAASLTVTGAVTATALVNCEVIVTQPSTSIGAGTNASLVVSVKPLAEGPWSVTLSVPSTDGDENPYNWILSGTAAASATAPNQSGSDGAGGTSSGGGSAGGKRGCGLGSGFTVILMLGVCIALGTRTGKHSTCKE